MGKVADVKERFVQGRKDFEQIAEETGAKLSTVKAQYYMWKRAMKASMIPQEEE